MDGPIRVADPDNVKQVIQDAKAQKATKVSSDIMLHRAVFNNFVRFALVSDYAGAKSCTNHCHSSSYTQFIECTNTP